MKQTIRRLATGQWPAVISALLSVGMLYQFPAVAQNRVGPGLRPTMPPTPQTSEEIDAYWTEERLASAIPMDLAAAQEPGVPATPENPLAAGDAQPGWAPGAPPSAAFRLGAPRRGDVQPQTTPPFTPPTSPTDFGNYSPFQRWTHFGNYETFPISTLGKLFFTQRGVNFVCSASVIARNTIATAGHCLHDGSGVNAGYSTNVRFCPGFALAGAVRGCWNGLTVVVSGNWFSFAATDRDFACAITAPTGSIFALPLGDVTGALGRTWNWPTRQAEIAYGYPAAAPFPGYHIIVATSTEWYEVNMTNGDGLMSKYIGSDLNGGSSGGPWWISIRHPNAAFDYGDTDGSGQTDPISFGVGAPGGGPYINGVNSHKRCNAAGCPAGSVFTQEMGSPQFTSTAADTDESEDVFATCFASGGS
jgi:V8-like Glu-specific endopeptidase